eukprot:2245804-Karenia_brevis.AAC.1
MRGEMDTLKQLVAEDTGVHKLVDPSYDRAPNFAILRLNTRTECSKSAVQEAAKGWLEGRMQPTQYQIQGPDTGMDW